MAKEETPVYDQPCAIVQKTRELLEADSRSLLDIFSETGLPFYWLKSFSEGRYKKNPSVNRVVFLYEFLSGNKIEV